MESTEIIKNAGLKITPYESYDGYVTVTKDGKFGIMTNEGKPVTELVFDGATPVVGGRAYVLKGGKWGLVSFGDSSYATSRTEATALPVCDLRTASASVFVASVHSAL